MGFWNTKDIAAARVTKQELVDVEAKHEGESYVIPRLVLHVDLLGKVADVKNYADPAAREALPEGAYKTDRVFINFWDVDDQMKKELLAQALEILAIPDEFTLNDFKPNPDGSAPNINLVGRDVYLKASVKEYNGRESVFFNLHRFLFEPKAKGAPVGPPASEDTIKRFQKKGYLPVAEARLAERERINKIRADKGGKRPAAAAAPAGDASDIPF